MAGAPQMLGFSRCAGPEPDDQLKKAPVLASVGVSSEINPLWARVVRL